MTASGDSPGRGKDVSDRTDPTTDSDEHLLRERRVTATTMGDGSGRPRTTYRLGGRPVGDRKALLAALRGARRDRDYRPGMVYRCVSCSTTTLRRAACPACGGAVRVEVDP